METILHYLIQWSAWLDVERALVNAYPDQKRYLEDYCNVYAQLHKLEPDPNDENMRIVIENGRCDESWHVYGLNELDTHRRALNFCRWEKWLGYMIDREVLKQLRQSEIVAHCLYTMGSSGFIQAQVLDTYAPRMAVLYRDIPSQPRSVSREYEHSVTHSMDWLYRSLAQMQRGDKVSASPLRTERHR